MSNYSFDVVRFCDLDSVRDEKVETLIKFFSDDNVFNIILRQAISTNKISVPSIYSDGVATCERGFFFLQNCLVFVDGRACFVVTQLSSLLYGILDLQNKVFYSQEFNLSRQTPLIDGIVNEEKLIRPEGKGFLGVINGYQRPYHYFYDKVPFLSLLDPNLIYASTALSIRDKAFLPALVFGFKSEVIVDDLSEYISRNEGFALDIGQPYRYSQKMFINALFEDRIMRSFSNSGGELSSGESPQPVIWLGCCQEKRKWVELYDALELFIDEIRKDFPKSLFIFDGLTRPEYMDENVFKGLKRVRNDVSEIMEFVKKFDDLSFFILAGKSAADKLEWAFRTDFFISNALTDSIWCSRFAKKNGLCFSSRSSQSEVLRQHRHPVATIFPFEKVKDLGPDHENWSKMDFSIDPYDFSKLALSKFKESYCLGVKNDT